MGKRPGFGEAGGRVMAQSNYAVFRTRPGNASEVYNVGRYIDEIVRTDGGLKFASRLCVYDSEMILNAVYLVEAGAGEDLSAAVAALRSEYEPLGFELELTGPWPTYNFVAPAAPAT